MSENNLETRRKRRQDHYLPTARHYYEEPMQLAKAKDQYVWDDKGKRYLDCFGGIICSSVGHNHPRIKARIQKALDEDMIQHTSYLYDHPYVGEATDRLLEQAPEGFDRVGFTNSGSEANEMALMSARTSHGAGPIVHFEHSYHGGTSSTLGHCGHSAWKLPNQPPVDSVAVKVPNCYRCPFGKKPKTCGLECAKSMAETLETVTSGKITAFLAEPILGVGGFITPPKEFFYEAHRLTKKYGGAYISDEVQTGIGRCGGSFFYTKALGIDADAITLAKSLGNGAAIGAIVGKSHFFEGIASTILFNTFGGDPYQTLQAAETIDIVMSEGLAERAQEQGAKIVAAMSDLAGEFPIMGDIRGNGLLLGIELVKDPKTKEYAPQETLAMLEYLREEGVLAGKGGLRGNVLRVTPPFCINDDDIQWLTTAMRNSLKRLAH